MNRSRVKIINLMTAVGVVAVNLAVGRAIYAFDTETFWGSVLVGPSLQMGLIRLMNRRGRDRAFWIGFVTAGSLAFLTFLLAEREGGSSTLWYRAWSDYTDVAVDWAEHFPGGAVLRVASFRGTPLNPALIVAASLIFFLPQLLAALTGGLLATFVLRTVSARLDRSPRSGYG